MSKESARAYVDEVWPQVVEDIASLVAVESVEDPATAGPGKPWGDGPRQALDVALGIASRLGLEAHDLDGAIGYAAVPGQSDQTLGIIAHVDVVPAGEGWDADPFTLRQRDGYLLGRGVIDDKGPFVLALWAAEYFRRQGTPLRYPIHVIAGANEETNMADVATYLERVGDPAFLFTPDASFPLCNGEKGRFGATFSTGPIAGGRIVSLKGGTVANAVPGSAEAVVRAEASELPAAPSIVVTPGEEPGTSVVRACGKGGHASLPEGTVNAIGLLMDYLAKNGLVGGRQEAFVAFEQLLCNDWTGASVGVAAEDERLGQLTLCAGVVGTKDGRFTQTIDIRYPEATTGDHLHAVLFKAAELHGCTMDRPDDQPPFYIEPDTPQIQCLLDAYEDVTGQEAKPFTMGGGTYARHFGRGVSFGPETAEELPDWVGTMHGPNEGVSEERLKEALAVYIDAIERLQGLDALR